MRLAVIQARMNSARLPGKVLEEINNKNSIRMIFDRLRMVNLLEPLIDRIVVATSLENSDDPIEMYCNMNGIECFRGSLEDVLTRYYDCATKYGADEIIRVTGDCPLIEPLMIWGLIKEPFRVPYKGLDLPNGRIVDGWDCEVMTYKALEEAYLMAFDHEREHVTTYLRKKYPPELTEFSQFDFRKLKLSLDTEDDLRRIREYAQLL